ncbi:MAG TPA: SDR family NAD(P)-dependent oxidoreductase [Acidimicrobiales bacterium]|nr:SDR family NAD(P)-dependent oxidoreductase [Acidimicrobiales bacterium]
MTTPDPRSHDSGDAPTLGLDGRTVVVAGAGGGGIGSAICRVLAHAGANVVGLDSRLEGLEDFERSVAGTSGSHRSRLTDVRDLVAVETAMAEAAEPGALAGMVHVAGGMWPPQWDGLLDMHEGVFDAVFDLNFRSVVHTVRAAGRQMAARQSGGSIVLIGSVAGITAMPYASPYAAAKAAVVSLTRTAALEWGRHDIRVNCVAPGTVRTPKNHAGSTPQDTAEERAALPLRRRGGPDDVAGAVLFLLSDLSSWITGQVLAVDGGSSVRPSFLDADDLPVFVHDPQLRARLEPPR